MEDDLLRKLMWLFVFQAFSSLSLTFGQVPGVNTDSAHEVFFLNLEHGYFGCQVNASADVLQIFDVSRMCDGIPQCFFGSDEVRNLLKCSDDCEQSTGHKCENGVCLESQCHCNDKFGGLGCEIPDENECKYRPCDIFAKCINTLGSFHCNCLKGYTGDGYHCQDINECLANPCGENAICQNFPGHFNCECKRGFQGDPFKQCKDINECEDKASCGVNAICLNTFGGYECHCPDIYTGNPYQICYDIGENLIRCVGDSCSCDDNAPCSNGYVCVEGKCRDFCAEVACGHNAVCSNGTCSCLPGWLGNATDGCNTRVCLNHSECLTEEVCAPLTNSINKCVHGCEATPHHCGPNSFCTTRNHITSCVCRENYQGLPDNFDIGCSSLAEKLSDSQDCKAGDPVCGNGLNCNDIALRGDRCVNSCSECIKPNENCDSVSEQLVCSCSLGFKRDSATFTCHPIESQVNHFECVSDQDCPDTHSCKINVNGEKICSNVCLGDDNFNCGANTYCVAINHSPVCQCMEGFTQSLEKANECHLAAQDGCKEDSDCTNAEVCSSERICKSACSTIVCGSEETCVSENHRAICKGQFETNIAATLSTSQASCVYNNDCEDYELCDRLQNKCINSCEHNPCGSGICEPKDHKHNCKCPPGTSLNVGSETSCKLPLTFCKLNSCHPSAMCVEERDGFKCVCKESYVGSPYAQQGALGQKFDSTGGCGSELCSENRECAISTNCQDGECSKQCGTKCGNNNICRAVNETLQCVCEFGFELLLSPEMGCVRTSVFCDIDADCPSESVCISNQCKISCIDSTSCAEGERCVSGMCMNPCLSSHQCPRSEVCALGFCVSGCRSSADCPHELTCNNYRCQDPCHLTGECGPNTNCHVVNHSPVCSCQEGFVGSPSVGCLRNPVNCSSHIECPKGYICVGGTCFSSCDSNISCAAEEICKNNLCMQTCHGDASCHSRHICLEGLCRPGCRTASNCETLEECTFGQCHCIQGFVQGITGCRDIDECLEGPCHPSAFCVNVPGSFKCVCHKDGTAISPETTCSTSVTSNNCVDNSDCLAPLICNSGTCTEPCSDSTTNCEKTSPECRSDDVCPPWMKCSLVSHTCIDICASIACAKGSCQVQDRKPICQCDKNTECQPDQICSHGVCKSSTCENEFDCSPALNVCVNGDCNLPCLADTDCQLDQACQLNSTGQKECQQLCQNAMKCGENKECYTENHIEKCRCKEPYQSGSDGNSDCELTCTENSECKETEICYNHRCKSVCLIEKCGLNADCFSEQHKRICKCRTDMTGSPESGCHSLTEIQANLCDDSLPGTNLSAGCPSKQQSTMIVKDQKEGVICSTNNDCSHRDVCLHGKCVRGCQGNQYCNPGEPFCLESKNTLEGQISCNHSWFCNSADGQVHCMCEDEGALHSRSPEFGKCTRGEPRMCNDTFQCASEFTCASSLCKPKCKSAKNCLTSEKCTNGHCVAICNSDKDCFSSEICENQTCISGCFKNSDCAVHQACEKKRCVDPCLAQKKLCGMNAVCKAQEHEAQCYCPPALTGDARKICIRPQLPCEGTSRCENGMSCAQGFCVAPCSRTTDCLENEKCVGSSCTTICGTDSDCRTNDICQSNICSPGCRSNDQCLVNHQCVDQKCEKLTVNAIKSCENGNELDEFGNCTCPLWMLQVGNKCVPCLSKAGRVLLENGTCTCEEDLIEDFDDANGDCVCPVERGLTNLSTKCSSLFQDSKKWRTDFPPPEMTVNCLADGIQVDIAMNEQFYVFRRQSDSTDENRLIYVKGHSKNPLCRKSVVNQVGPIDFKVKFGDCGLAHSNGEASFVLVIQKHLRLVTHSAQAFNIKCVYMTGEKIVTLDIDVSMITTMGTIANTGPPPTCMMRILTATGEEITSAQIGDVLVLRVEVQPASIYGGFVRNCVATTTEEDSENEYYVTDEHGCATEPAIFSDWEIKSDSQLLNAYFSAFKFPSSSSIKFQCNVRICFGRCQPVVCGASNNSFGRKKRETVMASQYHLGELREEVTVYSNPILAIERPESRVTQSADAQLLLSEDVCVSTNEFITSLAFTGITAILTVATALLVWVLICRKGPSDSPLHHPIEFPNPLLTTTSSYFEPVPDYGT